MSVPSLIAGAACLAGAAVLGWHHPLFPALVIGVSAGAAVVSAAVAHAWLVLLPGLLPVVDLAPWTGWLTFEEFDILALAVAGGAYLRRAVSSGDTRASRPSLLLVTLASLLAMATGIALARGWLDAGGTPLGLFQGYDGAMNSLRLAKPVFLALLFLPLFNGAVAAPRAPGIPYLASGMTLGLALASIAALWERVAFPGLLNFSADYRTTALFWEMHVGGAALDGFLALTVPFALWLAVDGARRTRLLAVVPVLVVAGYACLTTFSRGVYAALLVELAAFAWLYQRQAAFGRARGALAGPAWPAWWRAVGAGVALVCAYLVFRHGGYRALASVLGVLALAVAAGPMARRATPRQRLLALMFGAVGGGASAVPALLLERGVYLAYGAVLVLAGALWLRAKEPARSPTSVLAACVALAVAAANVAAHWGGTAALADAAVVLLIIGAVSVWNVRSREPVWPERPRAQATLALGAFALAGVVAVFAGGQYMGKRFAGTDRDLDERLSHWRAGLALLHSPGDWVFGKGQGRFPASFFFGGAGNEHPGSYQVLEEDGNRFLALSGARYETGGRVLRVSQRIGLVPGMHRLEFDLRAAKGVQLYVGMCEKHLLYYEACAYKVLPIKEGAPLAWRRQVVDLDARHLDGGAWYAPQLVTFSIALETRGVRAEVDNLALTDAQGGRVLANGDFSRGMTRWFFTSDHHHLPWHMKNLLLHVLFEQGVAGLVVVVLLVMVALSRLSLGGNRQHPLAPAMAAALVGFLIVGQFDSLLDVPRVAFLFLMLALAAIPAGRTADS